MINALIFDLDGTLVQTEELKALSYVRAAQELAPMRIDEMEFLEEFKSVVGLSRREVAMMLLEKFRLTELARHRTADFAVDAPWQAYVQIRLNHYEQMLNDPMILRRRIIQHNVELLKSARNKLKTGLATMSYCPQVRRVLSILELDDHFHFVASRDDVEHGKPNPEIYKLVACELGVAPQETLVIEDSTTGIQAALNAGMHCIAVTTHLTRDAVHASKLLDQRWIVDEPRLLMETVQQLLAN